MEGTLCTLWIVRVENLWSKKEGKISTSVDFVSSFGNSILFEKDGSLLFFHLIQTNTCRISLQIVNETNNYLMSSQCLKLNGGEVEYATIDTQYSSMNGTFCSGNIAGIISYSVSSSIYYSVVCVNSRNGFILSHKTSSSSMDVGRYPQVSILPFGEELLVYEKNYFIFILLLFSFFMLIFLEIFF